MVAVIKHIEIAGRDGPALCEFYRQVFGWPIERTDTGGFDYYNVRVTGEPTAGIRHEPDGKAELVIYYEVDDLEGSYQRALANGGTPRIPPTEYGELRFALLSDPEGNPVGLTQAPASSGAQANA